MLKEVKCLSCGYVLYRIGPLDNKGLAWGIYEEDYRKFESMQKRIDDRECLECHNCKKKNWLASKKVEGLGLQTWLSHVTE